MTVRRETDGMARLVFGRVELRAADGVILASLAVFSLLAVAGRAVVERWPLLVARNLCVCVAVLISAAVTPRILAAALATTALKGSDSVAVREPSTARSRGR